MARSSRRSTPCSHHHAGHRPPGRRNAIEAYTYFFRAPVVPVVAISEFGYADGALNIMANIAASLLYISLTPSQITLRTQVDSASPRRHGHAGQRLRRRTGSDPAGRQLL